MRPVVGFFARLGCIIKSIRDEKKHVITGEAGEIRRIAEAN